MKNKFLIIFFIISLLLITAVSANASEYRSEVKVGLKYGSAAGDSVTLSSSSGLTVYDAALGTVLYASQPSEDIYIQMGSTGFAAWNKFDASAITKISVQPAQGATII